MILVNFYRPTFLYDSIINNYYNYPWCVLVYRPNDRTVKQRDQQRQSHNSSVVSKTVELNSVDGVSYNKLGHRVDQSAAEFATMATCNTLTSGRQPFAKSSSTAIGSSQHQPLVGFSILIISLLVHL